MYFPYLRGKQFELITLRELFNKLQTSNKIIPVIEPVKKDLSNLKKTCNLYKDEGLAFVLISNPKVGELVKNSIQLRDKIIDGILKDYKEYMLGYIISETTDLLDIDNFLRSFRNKSICMIHKYSYDEPANLNEVLNKYNNIKYNLFDDRDTSDSYRNSFGNYQNIILHDGFRLRKNIDYPKEELFSDIHRIYSTKYNCNGYGDYLIVGEEYIDVGGPAYAVAIHITYKHKSGDIWIKHFVSDRGDTPVDPAGKFLEALCKFAIFYKSNEIDLSYSSACAEFMKLFERKHYPGLGYIKKLSMIHHIEMVSQIL